MFGYSVFSMYIHIALGAVFAMYMHIAKLGAL